MSSDVRIDDSSTWAYATPQLSVLIPFLKDDPSDLLEVLEQEAGPLVGSVELVVLDDGTSSEVLTKELIARVEQLSLPVRLVTLTRNEGRSRGRNRLSSEARGQYLLFLDSDMRPDSDKFLQVWRACALNDQPAVAFGGFSLEQASQDQVFAVHRSLAARSECLCAAERSLQPEKYVYTSNLLVRRDVFDAEAFDPDFTGWGWEDVEWAMRVSRRFPILHLDNPATHMGLDRAEALARKYEQSAPNFARVVAKHPDIVSSYPSYRVARKLAGVPGLWLLRRALRSAATGRFGPVRLRAFALRLYRASLYADVVR